MIKSFEDVQDYGKQGFDAWMASATAMTKGFQAVAAETAEYSKKSFEKSTAALQEIMAAKSLDRALFKRYGSGYFGPPTLLVNCAICASNGL